MNPSTPSAPKAKPNTKPLANGAKSPAEKERLAQALRQNLLRRKSAKN